MVHFVWFVGSQVDQHLIPMNRIILCLVSGALALLSACGGADSALVQETTTRGSIRISADDAFKQMLEAELYVFHSEYKYAKVTPSFTSEGDAMKLMLDDSVRLAVVGRKLTESEKTFLKSKDIFPKETLIAYDALTFIVNKDNPDTNISYGELKALFTGQNTGAEVPRIVFDSPKSGNARYLKEIFQLNELPPHCYAVQTNEEVLKYVESNPKAIGVVGSNLISDPDDTVTQAFTSRIKVMGVSASSDPDGKLGFRQPYQEYIADGSYPFKREVYILNREIGTRLGTGFASFVASDKGQRIILKSGLLPAVVPVRFVEINTEF